MGSSARLHVIGNVTEDIFFLVSRFPVAGETVLAAHTYSDLGGKGANQAVAAARAGAPVRFTTALGRDPVGARLEATLQQEPFELDLHYVNAPTDRSFISVREDGENAIVSSVACADQLGRNVVTRALRRCQRGDGLLVQGNLQLEVTRAALHTARERGVTTLLNAAPLRPAMQSLLPLCDYLVVNRGEAAALTDEPDPEAAGAVLLERGVGAAIITLGEEGAMWRTPTDLLEQRAPTAEVVDTTGAGDVFCGVFAARLLSGCSAGETLTAALHAASLTTTKRGTYEAIPCLDDTPPW